MSPLQIYFHRGYMTIRGNPSIDTVQVKSDNDGPWLEVAQQTIGPHGQWTLYPNERDLIQVLFRNDCTEEPMAPKDSAPDPGIMPY